MPRNQARFAAAGTVIPVAPWTSAAVQAPRPPASIAGTPAPQYGTLFLALTKTAGGTINPASESVRVQVSQDNGVSWCDVYDQVGDAAPVNLLAGQTGKSAVAIAVPIALFDVMRIRIAGDGNDDTYILDQDLTIHVA